MLNLVEIWRKCVSAISNDIDAKTLNTWIQPIKPISLNDNIFVIQVPNRFFYEWVGEHYSSLIEKK